MKSQDVGMVGFGRWGKNLARNFSNLNTLHTLCDINLPRDIPYNNTTNDFDSLLKNNDIKKIVIATPPNTHYTLAKKALLAGKDVFVEKPLCLNPSEGQELLDLATSTNLILMVGHLLHYHPCIQALKKNLSKIGDIKYITSNRLNSSPIRPENALWDLTPHDISIILSLTKEYPNNIHCQGSSSNPDNIIDNTLLTLSFNQIQAHIHASWVSPFKEQKLTVTGTNGSLIFDDVKPPNEKLTLYQNNTPSTIQIENKEPLLQECQHFLNCCLTRTTPLTDAEEALNVLKILSTSQSILSESQLAPV